MMAPMTPTAYSQDDAVRYAVKRAAAERACFWVYANADAHYVRAAEAAPPKGAHRVCIAQRWDKQTVQVRYAGARSEFVRVG